MPYLRRFCLITTRNGAKAYDLYETMNRQEYFRANGTFRHDAAKRNIATLMIIRGQDTPAMDCIFFDVSQPDPRRPSTQALQVQQTAGWFFQHGVQVDMSIYDEQEWEVQAAERAADVDAALELAHFVWNETEGDVASVDTMPLEMDDVSLADTIGTFSDVSSLGF